MAVTIEDGNISDAEAALRAAQEALRQALERGASDEEIKKLMEQLRAALDKFMQALAEELRKNPQQLARPLDRNTRELRPQDLKSMLDRIENLARSGAKDAARRLLEELQSMLENLQMARPGQQQDGDGDDDMMSALDELGDMIRKQQQLRDKHLPPGPGPAARAPARPARAAGAARPAGPAGPARPAGRSKRSATCSRTSRRCASSSRSCWRSCKQARPRPAGSAGPAGSRPRPTSSAAPAKPWATPRARSAKAMPTARSTAQGRALDAMRKGAQGLAQTMQQQMGRGPDPGQPGRTGQARANQDTDPLGRPLRGRDYGDDTTVKVPGEIDVQRARRILEELRRRFGDPLRPQLELDYIERLLKDF